MGVGRYSYRNQPNICRWNLEMLQRPLAHVIPKEEMEGALESFTTRYEQTYYQAMVHKLGFKSLSAEDSEALIHLTLQFLFTTRMGYHRFFQELQYQFSSLWREDPTAVLTDLSFLKSAEQMLALKPWKVLYYRLLRQHPKSEMAFIHERLKRYTPTTVMIPSAIKAVWTPINQADDWRPFSNLITNHVFRAEADV